MEWGNIPSWLALVVAGVGTLTAVRQFGRSSRAQRDQVQIARATLLLTIDRTFEGEDIYRSRKAIRSLRNRAERSVAARGPHPGDSGSLRLAIAEEFSREMSILWDQARAISDVDVDSPDSASRIAIDRYSELTALPNWIESIGMLCRRNLLPKDDVLDLYDQVVISTMRNFGAHFRARQEQPPYANRRFMENAFWLLDEAEAFKAAREAMPPAIHTRSPTNWA